ncbi:MAG TPA: hypothetical protein VII74_04890 [Chthoniobacterales bacterium]
MEVSARAPAAGVKLMLLIVILFGLAAIYGQWQHARRPEAVHATILALPNVSPAPSPNEP